MIWAACMLGKHNDCHKKKCGCICHREKEIKKEFSSAIISHWLKEHQFKDCPSKYIFFAMMGNKKRTLEVMEIINILAKQEATQDKLFLAVMNDMERRAKKNGYPIIYIPLVKWGGKFKMRKRRGRK